VTRKGEVSSHEACDLGAGDTEREHAPFPVQAMLTDLNRSAHQLLDRREQPMH
jgi:hypothetical protein